MSQFTSINSARGNWGIRNSGRSAQYAILLPGEHGNREMISLRTRQNQWRTIIQLWQRYKDDGDSLIDLEQLADAVLASLDAYPHIGDTGATVHYAQIINVGRFNQIPLDAPAWLYVELVGEAIEHEEITFSE
jgi:hypothetical protein